MICEVIESSHGSEVTSTCRGNSDGEKGNTYTHEIRDERQSGGLICCREGGSKGECKGERKSELQKPQTKWASATARWFSLSSNSRARKHAKNERGEVEPDQETFIPKVQGKIGTSNISTRRAAGGKWKNQMQRQICRRQTRGGDGKGFRCQNEKRDC